MQSVGMKFLDEVELDSDDLRVQIANHMAKVHLSVKEISSKYLKSSKRYNYVTPKSFLELVDFYKSLLADKRAKVESLVDRLDTGKIGYFVVLVVVMSSLCQPPPKHLLDPNPGVWEEVWG